MFSRPPAGAVPDPEDLAPWMGVEGGPSLIDLMRSGSVEPRGVAVLWALLARRASLIVAAMPRLAGKSTTLAALLGLTPKGTLFHPIGGRFSRADVQGLPPDSTYLVVNELSEHIPGRYLWGPGVGEVFRARVEQGFSFAATIHAWTADGVLDELSERSLGVTSDLLAGLDVIVTLRSAPRQGRGVETVSVRTREDGRSGWATAVDWDAGAARFRYAAPEETVTVLARWAGEATERMAAELEARTGFLAGLVDQPPSVPLREALTGAAFF